MNKLFYPKIAGINLKKNKSTYIPYMLACIGSIMTFFIICSIAWNKGIDTMVGADSLKMMLNFGIVVIGLFSLIFLFYTNSFLIKRRKKELGLYSILGLEKKHIAWILFFETLYIAVISLAIGISGGLLVGKLIFLLLLKMLKLTVAINIGFSVSALITTSIVFSSIFLLTFISNFIHVQIANPIALLRGGKEGEKEPKTSWLLTILGILSLGSGYVIALRVESPLEALALFFVAVILVIIGTYALFSAGSIALLKGLKKNKKFFYQSKNFVAVSGMIYRMKQNAVGLANICILSTMVLVTISTTVALYIGQEEALKQQYFFDTRITNYDNQISNQEIDQLIEEQASQNNVGITDKKAYNYYYLWGQMNAESITVTSEMQENNTNMVILTLISLDDYNQFDEKTESLMDNEVMIYSTGEDYLKDHIAINETEYQVKKSLKDISITDKKDEMEDTQIYIIVKDPETAQLLANSFELERYAVMFNISGEDAAKYDFGIGMNDDARKISEDLYIWSIELMKADWYAVFGGFLFIGLFLGCLFMMATALIIYFKQISEGYDDHDRFEILQKVGMDKREVKKTIHKQIIMVFFLPLFGAVLNVGFAFHMITKMLAIFSLTDVNLILLCTVGTVILFAIYYGVVYALTARSYYKLVE